MQYDFIINKNNFKNYERLLALMLEKNKALFNLSSHKGAVSYDESYEK